MERYREGQNLPAAIISGLFASLIGAGVWALFTAVSEYQIGFMAIGVGFLVGYSVRIAGKGVDLVYGITGAVLSFFGCILGNFLTVIYFIAMNEEMPFMSVLSQMNLESAVEVMVDTFDPMDLLFYGIAIYFGFRMSFLQISQDVVNQVMNMAPEDIHRMPIDKTNPRILIIIAVALALGFTFLWYELRIPSDSPIDPKKAVAAPRGERVQSSDGTVSIVAPPEWKVDLDFATGVKIMITSPLESINDTFAETIFVNSDVLQSWHTLDYYVETNMSNLNPQYNLVRLSDTQTSIDGIEARRIVSKTNKMQGLETVWINYFVKVENVAYSINAVAQESSFKRWQPTLDGLCQTVKFRRPTRP